MGSCGGGEEKEGQKILYNSMGNILQYKFIQL